MDNWIRWPQWLDQRKSMRPIKISMLDTHGSMLADSAGMGTVFHGTSLYLLAVSWLPGLVWPIW